MTPAADDVRALASSSPWLWRTLHLRARSEVFGPEPVEAWVQRVDSGLARAAVRSRGTWHLVEHPVAGGMSLMSAVADPPRPGPQERRLHLGTQAVPRRSDGLVAAADRPSGAVVVDDGITLLDADDPMWQSYLWVAMLDPVELASGVELTRAAEAEVAGRPVWTAFARVTADYEPRCSCCPLLDSEVADRLDGRLADGEPLTRAYPDGYGVALDRGTGVAVRLRAHGVGESERARLDLDAEILGVDLSVDDVLEVAAAEARTRRRPRGRRGWSAS